MINSVSSFFNSAVDSLKYKTAKPSQRFIYDIERSVSLKDYLNKTHRTLLGPVLGALKVDAFIRELQQALTDKCQMKRFDFASISEMEDICQEDKLKISRLALKILLGKNAYKGIGVTPIEEAIDHAFLQIPKEDDVKELINCSPEARAYILETMKLIGTSGVQYLRAICWLSKNADLEKKNKLLKTITKFPADERVNRIYTIYVSVNNPLEHHVYLNELLRFASSYIIDRSERAEIVKLLYPFLANIQDDQDGNEIIDRILKVPHYQRNDLIIAILPLLIKFCSHNKHECFYIIDAVWHINPSERITMVNISTKLIAPDFNGFLMGDCIVVTKMFRTLSPNEREAIVRQTQPLMGSRNSFVARRRVLSVMGEIPEAERNDIVEKLLPFTDRISNSDVIAGLYHIPKKERSPELIEGLITLFKAEAAAESRLVETLGFVLPEDVRAKAVIRAAPYASKIGSEGLRTAILCICANPESTQFFENKPLSDEKDHNLIVQIFLALHSSEKQPFAKVESLRSLLCMPLCNNKFLDLFLLLPIESRTDIHIHAFRSALNSIMHISLFINRIVVPFIAPECWEEAFKLIGENSGFDNESILAVIFREETIREPSVAYLRQRLDSNLSPQQKYSLAKKIMDNAEIFQLHEEHPLVQHAISIASICDPDALKNPKNPFRVYQEIKQAIATEGWIDIRIHLKPPLNIQKLREKGVWKGYTIQDLPEGVGPNTLHDLFHEIKDRVNQLSEEERKAVNLYIQNSCESTLEILQDNMIGKPFHTVLLKRNQLSDPSVTPTQFQMYAAMRYILDADTTIPQGEIVSPREDLLLKMSTSVQNCTTGQRDGLANYYNALPQKYKKGPKAEEGAVAQAEGFVDSCVQKSLNSTFSNEAFLKEVTGENIISQPAHQSEYLKNRYHRQVGLHHQPVFDVHTGVLHHRLLSNDHKKVLSCFFHRFSSAIIQQIVIDSQEGFKDNLFVGIEALLKRVCNDMIGQEGYQRYISFTEDLEPIQLTEDGAKALLLSTGYLF